MDYQQIIYNIMCTSGRGISKVKLDKIESRCPNIKSFILSIFDDSESVKETLHRLQYLNGYYGDISDELRSQLLHKPLCPCCNKPLPFIGKPSHMFQKYCSNSCRSKLINGPHWQEAQHKYNEEHYGVKYNVQTEQFKNKRKQTLIDKHGSAGFNNIEKRRKTCFEKYGDENYSNKEQRDITLKKNNSYNISGPEEVTGYILKMFFKEIIKQYKCKEYPFHCDFYIPEKNLFIECNYHWTHGGHLFDIANKDDIELLDKWKKQNTNYYNKAIETWTDLDVRKYNKLIENNLNFKIFYSYDEFIEWVFSLGIKIFDYSNFKLNTEYNKIKEKAGVCSNNSCYNAIIKYFQENTFYKYEIEKLKNYKTAKRLFDNRIKYLNKTQFTNNDIISGFKKSGIHYGYSHFNPLLFKWFINEYNIKSCYDPCGGWGHRLLGASELDLYIYNDLSKATTENVDKIINYFNITNTVTYCNDANNFIPNESFEAMFTCPPYYNLETYECKSFDNMQEYNSFLDNLFNCFYSKESCKIFGLVIREDFLPSKYKYKHKFDLKNRTSHLNKNTKENKEFLYVFIKE